MRILFLLILCTTLIKTKLVIKDANMAAISRDDIGMIFYVELHNSDNCRYHVMVKMVKCIEEVDVSDKDCEIMQLIGGDMGYLKPKCYKNITLLYPNMYLHNRKGYCIIAIRFETEDHQILEKKTNVSFNTIISNTKPVPYHLRGYYTRKEVTVCESVDLDPLKHCQPVDCHMKYVGTRSYFNHRWLRCQKVPKCIYDMDKKLPDVGYSPITNKCLDLERCIVKSDVTPLENKFEEMTQEVNKFSALLTTLNCHFGKMNNETGVCDCLPGWDSEPFDIEPSLFAYHMCNIERVSWYDSNRSMVTFVAFFIAIAAVGVAMIVVILSFILYHLYKCLKSFEASRRSYEDGADAEAPKDKKLVCICPSPKDSKSSLESKTSAHSKASQKSNPSDKSKPLKANNNKKSKLSKESVKEKKNEELPPAEPIAWKLGTFRKSTEHEETSWKLGTFGESSRKHPPHKDRNPRRSKSPDWKLGTFAPKMEKAEHPWKLGTFSPHAKSRIQEKRKSSESSIKSKHSKSSLESKVTFDHSGGHVA